MNYRTIAILMLILVSNVASADEQQRLISTDGDATELIVGLGLANKLVAVDVTSKMPKTPQKLANIGYHRNLSAEGLLSLKPTTVIGNEAMGPPVVVRALQQANIQLIRLPSAHTSDQLRSNISKLAKALDRVGRGKQLLQLLDSKLVALNSKALTGNKIAFLLVVEPTKLRLAGYGSSGNALINLMGASSVAKFNNYQTISAESLMAMQPDIIMVAGEQRGTAVAKLLQAYPVLRDSSAGINHRIVAVDANTLVAGLSVAAVGEALRLVTQLNNHVAK